MVSLGVQSFNDRRLKVLGRDYDAKLAKEACRRVLGAGFAAVDIDLIFAIPGQSVDELEDDIGYAVELGADQISAYPLMFFAYMPFRQKLERAKAEMPGWWAEREMLKVAVKAASAAGYRRTSIWSFNKPEARRYTTVTKDSFVGVGVGASTMMGDYFSVNTFSLPEYIGETEKGLKPALAAKLDDRDKLAYWLFWRCYDLAIDTGKLKELFGRGLPFPIRGLLPFLEGLGYRAEGGHNPFDREGGLPFSPHREGIHTRLSGEALGSLPQGSLAQEGGYLGGLEFRAYQICLDNARRNADRNNPDRTGACSGRFYPRRW